MRSNSIYMLRRQQGAVLIISLLALVAITMSALALMRTRDTSTLIAGNVAFRQVALAGADRAVEAARTWLLANVDNLASDHSADGYYSSKGSNLDISGFGSVDTTNDISWDGTGSNTFKAKVLNATPDPDTGLVLSYIILRLCQSPGLLSSGTDCASFAADGDLSRSSKGAFSYQGGNITGSRQIFYRIIVRALGAKNTVSYIETVVLI